jgi:hypothetical protein
LDKNTQKIPFRKNNKGQFTRKYCENFQTSKLSPSRLSPSKLEPSITNFVKISINNFKDSKVYGLKAFLGHMKQTLLYFFAIE